jgi:hypothetical protein
VNKKQLTALWIGGIIILLRCFYPVKYIVIRGVKFDPSTHPQFLPTTDFYTTILQVLGIAILTAIIIYSLKDRN